MGDIVETYLQVIRSSEKVFYRKVLDIYASSIDYDSRAGETRHLEFAELQAKEHIPMYIKDWLERLDDFLRVSRRELLTHAGIISHEVVET